MNESESANANDKSSHSGKAFFVGVFQKWNAKAKTDGSGSVTFVPGSGTTYVASKALSARGGKERDIVLAENSVYALRFNEEDFVFGLEPVEVQKRPFLFFTHQGTYPVQLVPWSSFRESSDAPDARSYFSNAHRQKILTTSCPYVIGNYGYPGKIIIVEDCEDGQKRYLKGFSHMGKGQIQVSDVSVFTGDFQELVWKQNQPFRETYMGHKVRILIPPKSMTGPHTVLECDGWEPLVMTSRLSPKEEVTPQILAAREAKAKRAARISAEQKAKNDEGLKKHYEAAREGSAPTIGKPQLAQFQLPKSSTSPETHMTSESTTSVPSSAAATANSKTDGVISEIEFLESFKAYVVRCGFKYSDRDLVRFHTSVKSGYCTLLAGDPGTGKSSIVELYARALSGRDGWQRCEILKRVNVSPSWMESADLLGYKKDEHTFIPAGNGLSEYLRDRSVAAGKNLLSIVCLEEINLARVEHYFSDFIQAFSRGPGVISGYENEDRELAFDNNMRFVGTCNADESTHSMSDRFYDRANQLEFHLSDDDLRCLVGDIFSGKSACLCPYEEGDAVPADIYVSKWASVEGKGLPAATIMQSLLGMQEGLQEARLAPSPRVIGEIVRYIRLRPMFGCETEEDRQKLAFDEQLAQRVLARAQATPGTIAALKDLLGKCKGFELSTQILNDRIKDFNQMFQSSSLDHDAEA